MSEEHDFFKFPRTRHIFDAGGHGVSRDDLVMDAKERELFLKNKKFTVEEKVDGANLGISITKNFKILTQNRSHFVNSSSHKQFSKLDEWIEQHSQDLHKIIEPENHILFGEWLLAKHSIHYSELPNYFIAFDIYDKTKQTFLSTQEREERLQGTSICTSRIIHDGIKLDQKTLLALLETKSSYYDGFVEGIVIKEFGVKEVHSKEFFKTRVKLVRPDFLQGIEEQWTRQKFLKNRLLYY